MSGLCNGWLIFFCFFLFFVDLFRHGCYTFILTVGPSIGSLNLFYYRHFRPNM